jgi:hypothetical protein
MKHKLIKYFEDHNQVIYLNDHLTFCQMFDEIYKDFSMQGREDYSVSEAIRDEHDNIVGINLIVSKRLEIPNDYRCIDTKATILIKQGEAHLLKKLF